MTPYPLTIIFDRYGGTYSGGKFTAFNIYPDKVPCDIYSDDVTCSNFWKNYKGVVGIGNTPNEAINNMKDNHE